MTDLNAQTVIELKKPVASEVYAVEILLPNRAIRLIDGAGFVRFNTGDQVHEFSGSDDVYGVLAAADNLSDGFGDNAPSFNFSLLPATDGATLSLSNPVNQLSPVRVWAVTRNPQTNEVIGAYLRFNGFFDFAVTDGSSQEITIDMQCITHSELFFRNNEGVTLSNSFHQSIWPGENGFRFVTGIQRSIIWGPGDRPQNIAFRGGNSGVSTGGARTFGQRNLSLS